MKFLELYREVQELTEFHTNYAFFKKCNDLYTQFINEQQNKSKKSDREFVYDLLKILAESNLSDDSKSIFKIFYNSDNNSKKKATVTLIPHLHPAQINIADLKENGRLLTDEEFQKLKQKDAIDEIKYKIDTRTLPCFKLGGKYYITGSLLSNQKNPIYLAQEQESGEWFVLKDFSFVGEGLNEEKILIKYSNFYKIGLSYTANKEHNKHIISMNYINSLSLDKFNIKNSYIPVFTSLQIVLNILNEAKKFLFQGKKNIRCLHRDIKPHNFLINTTPLSK